MRRKDSVNFVLHAKSDQFYWKGSGQLSIKTFCNGQAFYQTKRGFFAVEEDRYLLLNKGDYTLEIDESRDVESFCVFFRDGFAEEVFRSLSETPDRLLSDPFRAGGSIEFFEKTYPKNEALTRQLNRLKSVFADQDTDSVGREEQFHMIMHAMLSEHLRTCEEVESLHAVRRPTREELYRRISIAHDYVRSCYRHPIRLDDIAKVACLSPNHLLRSYVQVYGKTPHQHISEYRVRVAKQLLEKGDCSVTHIAFEFGFQDLVSFSCFFKKQVGLSPKQYQKGEIG